MTDELPLRYLLMGPSKAGKSWQSLTGPPPTLSIDLEGRARYSPQGEQAVFWNGEDDPKSIGKSASRTYILETTSLQTLSTARQWLRTGSHPFKTVVLDSVMELKYLIEKDKFPGQMDLDPKQKGAINKEFEDTLRDIRDLTTKPGPTRCVVFITGAVMDPFQKHIKPVMSGKIGELIPYWMDLVAYMESEAPGGGSFITRKTYLAQRPSNDLEVGDGTNRIITKLGNVVSDLTVQQLFDALQTPNEEK